MNSLSVLLLSSLISYTLASSSVSVRTCSRALEQIVYKPPSYAFLYMQSLARKFRPRGQILFGPVEQADAYIFTFASENKVEVTLSDAFAIVVNYHPDGTKFSGSPVKYANTAQAYLNLPGFVKQTSNEIFITLSRNSRITLN